MGLDARPIMRMQVEDSAGLMKQQGGVDVSRGLGEGRAVIGVPFLFGGRGRALALLGSAGQSGTDALCSGVPFTAGGGGLRLSCGRARKGASRASRRAARSSSALLASAAASVDPVITQGDGRRAAAGAQRRITRREEGAGGVR